MKPANVVIVGGGLAGLYAAYLLHRADISFVLLEAAPRLGGRILSEPAGPASKVGFDLGPTWFWRHQPTIHRVLNHLKLPVFEQFARGDALYQVDLSQKPERFSSGGMPSSSRVVGGTFQLIQALAKDLAEQQLLLNHGVSEIKREHEGWLVRANHMGKAVSFSCKHLVLALPPRVIHRDLNPAAWCPEGLARNLALVPTWMAGQAKFVATYDTPFWREQGLSGQVMSRCGPMMEIHDASASDDAGFALFGFLGWPAAARKSYGTEVVKGYCQQQLVALFGEQARNPKKSFLKDWALDSWITTGADLQGPSAHPQINLNPFRPTLQKKNLHFISTEFATQEAGYLEGALIAAEAGVQEIQASGLNQD